MTINPFSASWYNDMKITSCQQTVLTSKLMKQCLCFLVKIISSLYIRPFIPTKLQVKEMVSKKKKKKSLKWDLLLSVGKAVPHTPC